MPGMLIICQLRFKPEHYYRGLLSGYRWHYQFPNSRYVLTQGRLWKHKSCATWVNNKSVECMVYPVDVRMIGKMKHKVKRKMCGLGPFIMMETY